MLARKKDEALSELQAELLLAIAQLESIQFYKSVADKMAKNATILKLIKQKKRVQKELVNAQYVKKQQQAAVLKQQLEEVEATLFSIPLYQQYLTAVDDAQEVLDIVSDYIQSELSIEDIESQE